MFLDKLLASCRQNQSLLCIGLDPDPALAPLELVGRADWAARFGQGIVEATADLVCAYKPNLAFYEALGTAGWQALGATLAAIPRHIPVIADAKCGDVGHSARAYARALFDTLNVDAATVNPYLGFDSLEPFLAYRDRGILVLCRTSNPGGADFQDLPCRLDGQEMPLFEAVARRAVQWNRAGNVGLVVGATYPTEVAAVRGIAPDLPLLIPGIGAQAGDLASAVRAGVDRQGERVLIAVSRQVLYASRGTDWAAAARAAALALRDAINQVRELQR